MYRAMIIGAGGIAPAHIEGFLAFRDKVEIVAVVNRNIARATDMIARYDLRAEALTDYREGLERVDIVAICTPPATHREMAVACLERDIHVLVEKPMALSLSECDAILEAAGKSKAQLSVVAQSRFISSIAKTVKLLHAGRYGRILFGSVNSYWWRGQSYYDLAWRGTWESEGGGCTLNHAIHHIDLLLWVKGMPIEITSYMNNLNHGNSEEEDLSVSILRYRDGSVVQLTCSLLHHGEEQKLNFQLEKVGVSIPYAVTASKPRENGFPLANSDMMAEFNAEYENLEDLEYEHHTGQIADFLGAITGWGELLVTGVDGRNALELITAIYDSATSGKPVHLPLAEDSAFYTLESKIKNAPHFNEKIKSVSAFSDTTITSFKGKY